MSYNSHPNILIFMADHYRGDMAPPFGRCLTPNIDSIYNDGGLAFTNCYTVSHCCLQEPHSTPDYTRQNMVSGTM